MKFNSAFYLAFLIVGAIHSPKVATAGPGDTTIVQTFTFDAQNNPNTNYDSPGRRWFMFPSEDTSYQKILMYHTLKCFEDGTAGGLGFPCGEWDYLTYTNLFQHTGAMDSNFTWTPHYKFNNQNFTTVNVLSEPYYNYWQYSQSYTVVDEVITESVAEIGDGTMEMAGPFVPGSTAQRSQYLWTAQELSDAGLVAGELQKVSLDFSGDGDIIHHLYIRMKLTSDTELTSMQESGWVNVYEYDLDPVDGWNDLVFTSPFTWDGSSNIVVEVGHTGNASVNLAPVAGDDAGFGSAASISGIDRYIHFDWYDEVKVPQGAFTNVSDEITISFWLKGDAQWQPMDGTCFEGGNSLNQRVLNSHLPWSNSNVYWDAGWDGGYDRINKLAAAADYEGQWNHWAFTKNATTGDMKIFLNGVLWHSGVALDNLMTDIVKFSIGAAVTWSNFYRGSVDEFAIFNTALDATEIASWMNRDLDATHQSWNNLQAYYQFNALGGNNPDASGNGYDAYMHGNASISDYAARDLFRNVALATMRPAIRFSQGEYDTHTEQIVGVDEIEVQPASLAEYVIEDYQPVALAPQYYYPQGYGYTYDPGGAAIDSTWYAGTQTIVNDSLWYFQAPFEIVKRYELGRYITPYGIQLDLGGDGWTWIYDVTDFEPLLHDSVEIEAGNWQELLDLKFVFIEGEPAREVERIENVWNGNYGLSTMDQYVTEKTFDMEEGELSVKLRTTVTGHGFGNGNNCAEFCYNEHSLVVNGTTQWQWNIIQDCATNPLYPQGGTWIYARAGWCPGMEGKTNEFELTPFLQGGSVSADYNIEADPYGNYVTESQVVYYGPNLHAHDPEIDMILSPSTWKIHSRWNPMCDDPKFILRNKGSEPLTDLNIYFGMVGGTVESFHWTGNLGFMESEEVVLTSTDPAVWQGDDGELLTFFIELGESSDGPDDNPSNNFAASSFYRPPLYHYNNNDDNRVIVIVGTNQAYWETEVTLSDRLGNVLFHRDNYDIASNTFRDTLELNAGCYHFHLFDSGDDGLSFFANNDGNGSCRLDRVQGLDFINFEKDFGREINHYFYFDTDLVTVNEMAQEEAYFEIVPNPASGSCHLKLNGFDPTLRVEIWDTTGKIIMEERMSRAGMWTSAIDISAFSDGVYTVRVSDGKRQNTQRMVVQ